MTKKTRIRVARIAAGAVIAAGASLTAAGAASAVGVDINVGPLDASVNADRNGIDAGLGLNPPEPTGLPTVIPDPTPTEEPPTEEPPTEEPPTEEPPTEEPPTEEPPTEEPPTEEPPTEDPTENPDPSESTTPGGTGGTDTDGGVIDGDGNNTDTDNAGSQPVEQGQAKEELAETGAAETTFLLLGAATMIAGGIGFRMLPRLVGSNRTAV
ncbi:MULTISPECIES: LPXTG cell wall anchor domain-containing protein [unclassified Streptomyces]|uniref:LPXTG cell wall anchor domain-containing protein n=1 Tax=unclassified Streptomyces TaxID=2593676 RepID=UPI0028C4E9C7|nr:MULTISPECIES: LPXTG cell wall anchor domain-containing protein [unclassified Streptomyces]WNO74271.1 LPXTG cell wall anchor domain-containing protein [Streptomyces sp. AM8-1-1]